jgi:hypothetical protein
MSSDPDVRSRYLALALDARRVIDSLIPLADEGKRQEGLAASLQEVIDSLQSLITGGDLFSPLRNRTSFSEYYEQVRTVDEVLGPSNRDKIIEKLLSVQADQEEMEQQKADAFEAIELLMAIESSALHRYRPEP